MKVLLSDLEKVAIELAKNAYKDGLSSSPSSNPSLLSLVKALEFKDKEEIFKSYHIAWTIACLNAMFDGKA